MKLAKQLFYLFLCVPMLLLSSCKDDDPEADDTNTFDIDGKSYALTQGILQDYGVNDDGSFDFDLSLISSGISYNSAIDEFTGKGNIVYIDLNTSSEAGLVKGTYTFEASGNRAANNFVDVIVGTDYDISSETGGLYQFATAGTVVINEINGAQVSMTFDITFPNGKTCKGNYTGELK